jgi:undecaprenyl-diphosphatase
MIHLITKRFRSFHPRDIRLMFWLSGALAFAGVFVKLAWEISTETELNAFDRMIMGSLPAWRHDSWNGMIVDVTALGSVTLGVLFSVIAGVFMLFGRDRAGALQLALAGLGSAVLTQIFKSTFSRPRPDMAPHLVTVEGTSFPSGHALSAAAIYLTLAILASRNFKEWKQRTAIFTLAALIIVAVGLSRVYLGVHYPSDALSGIALGSSWALFLAGIFSRLYWRDESVRS